MEDFNWGARSIERMSGCHPLLREFANRLLSRSSIDLTIPQYGGLRAAHEQLSIYKTGASRLNGYDRKSYHQTGRAIDVVSAGKTIGIMYDVDRLRYINKVAKIVWQELVDEDNVGDYEMTFGCDWTRFVDLPHYQIKKR